jgi:membrane carboxypeptidase/penicillin-binding protein PbpC
MLAAQARVAAGDMAGSDQAVMPVPTGLHEVTICAISGERANPWCPSRLKEWLPADADAAPPCSWHHQSEDGLLTVYPPEYRAWAATTEAAAASSFRLPAPLAGPASASRHPVSGSQPRTSPLAIANPPDGAIYSIDPTLRREFQALPLRAVTERPTTIRWSVDGAPIGTSSSDRALAWPLAVGSHRIEVRDGEGRRAATSVVVR